jgi:carboxyl-terminal processing protease
MSKRVYIVIVLGFIVGLTPFLYAFLKPSKPPVSNNLFEIKKNLDIFYSVYSQVEDKYAEEPQPGALMKVGIDAMLNSLDPYTVYYPENLIEDARILQLSNTGDIGVKLEKIDGNPVFTEIDEDGPADKVGVHAGDILLSIEGKAVKDLDILVIQKQLQGPENTTLKLEYSRKGKKNIVEIQRKKTAPVDVPYFAKLDNGIGYIKLQTFINSSASGSVRSALEKLQNENIKGLILDLRGNGGGLLQEAVNILGLFVPTKSKVVTMKGRSPNFNKEYYTSGKPIALDLPLVVLVDNKSASASEIVAGTIQDMDRGIIVGQTSFGKGLVQQVHDVAYNGKMKITVAKYYTASGRCIQKLNYFNKKNGKVESVKEEERKSFLTKNGRTVLDGKGVEPDIYVDTVFNSKFIRLLVDEKLIFNYATKYQQSRAEIGGPEAFKLSEEDYEDFSSYVISQNLEYESLSSQQLLEFEAILKKEKYLERVDPAIEMLKKRLDTDAKSDLKLFKAEIIELLEKEIISRYHYSSGKIKYQVRKDEEVLEASKILLAPAKYIQILSVR